MGRARFRVGVRARVEVRVRVRYLSSNALVGVRVTVRPSLQPRPAGATLWRWVG